MFAFCMSCRFDLRSLCFWLKKKKLATWFCPHLNVNKIWCLPLKLKILHTSIRQIQMGEIRYPMYLYLKKIPHNIKQALHTLLILWWFTIKRAFENAGMLLTLELFYRMIKVYISKIIITGYILLLYVFCLLRKVQQHQILYMAYSFFSALTLAASLLKVIH